MTTPDSAVLRRSVESHPTHEQLPSGGESFILSLSTVADSFEPFGANVVGRDRQLRAFWPTEPILASALYSVTIRNAAFSWELEGPPATVEQVQNILHTANLGKGWLDFMAQVIQDLFTQDNGAFIEIIRLADSPRSPVVGINHLDAGKCTRTGMPDFPVIYTDRLGKRHKMAWYQIATLEEFPSPVESMNGVQLCAVSRILRAAQILKDISVYQREKISGDNPNAIHILSGVKAQEISDAVVAHKDQQLDRGMTRYVIPAIVGTLDPSASISMETINLKSIPDGFEFEESMRWYINQLALGFGADYQDFSPLPGKGLGTSAQSLVLHMKSRGKGPAFFMSMIEYLFNFQGIMPQNVTFRYNEQDIAAEAEEADVEKVKAETREIYVQTGVLTPEAVRQQMLDDGELSEEEFAALQVGTDITPDITAQDDVPVEDKARHRRRRRRYSSKQDELADFGEDQRLDLEDEVEEALARVLSTTFDEAKRIIGAKSRIRRKQTPEDLLEDAAFWERFQTRMVGAALPLIRKGALEAAELNLGLGLAVDMDLVNQAVIDFSTTYSNTWWQRLETTTRNSLRRSIVAWQDAGLGSAGLPDLVNSIEPMFGAARAERIAATEVTRIFDEGSKLAQQSAGIETQEWQTSKDARVDDICRALDGKRFPIDEGPRPVQDTHVGCRCARLPVSGTGQTLGR